MATLPPVAIYAYNKAAGFKDPVTATALVLAESGGVTDVHGPQQYFDQRSQSWKRIDPVGIWQIETISHGVSAANASNPAWATSYAYQLSKGGTDYSPWEAYTAGTYQAQLPAAKQAETQYMTMAAHLGQQQAASTGSDFHLPGPGDVLKGILAGFPPFAGIAGAGEAIAGLLPSPGDIAGGVIGNIPGGGVVQDIWDSLRSGNLLLRAGLAVLGFAGILMGAYIAFSGAEGPDFGQLGQALKGSGGGGSAAATAAEVAV